MLLEKGAQDLFLQLQLECGYLSLYYYEYKKAKEFLNQAKDMARLKIMLSGKTLFFIYFILNWLKMI